MTQFAQQRSRLGGLQQLLRREKPKWRWIVVVTSVILAAASLGPKASRSVIALSFCLPALILLLRRPRWHIPLLIIACAFVPFRVRVGAGATITLAMPAVAGLTVLWGGMALLRRDLSLRASPANLLWILLVVVAGLSVVAGAALWSPWVVTADDFLVVQGAQLAIIVLSACAYWLGANQLRGRDQLRRVVNIVLLLGLIYLALVYVPPLGRFARHLQFTGPTFRICVVSVAAATALNMMKLRPRLRLALAVITIAMVALPWWRAGDWASGWLPSFIAASTVLTLWAWDRMRWRILPFAVFAGLAAAVFFIPYLASGDYYSLDTRIIALQGLVQLLEGRWILGLGLASYWHYWRGMIGSMSYWDPASGRLHYTYDPKVNLHNNYLDVLGQMGILGLLVLLWLLAAIALQLWRSHQSEEPGFGKAYAAAAIGILAGMSASGMLGDWFLPFVYNIGLQGFHDSFLGWLLLGGAVVLAADPSPSDTPDDEDQHPS